jgi:hypothetical protein
MKPSYHCSHIAGWALFVLMIGTAVASAAPFHGVFIEGTGVLGCDGQWPGVTSISCDTGFIPGSRPATGPVIARTFQSADLATGELKLFAQYSGDTRVTAYDRLTFFLPDGLSTATVGFRMDVDGTANVGNGGLHPFLNANFFAGLRVIQGVTALGDSHGWVWVDVADAPPSAFDFSLFVERDIANGQSVDLVSFLSSVGIPGTLDASNTGAISLVLPEGVTFTSDSGVFLSQANGGPTPVPEPGQLPLLISGLVALALRARSHSKAEAGKANSGREQG